MLCRITPAWCKFYLHSRRRKLATWRKRGKTFCQETSWVWRIWRNWLHRWKTFWTLGWVLTKSSRQKVVFHSWDFTCRIWYSTQRDQLPSSLVWKRRWLTFPGFEPRYTLSSRCRNALSGQIITRLTSMTTSYPSAYISDRWMRTRWTHAWSISKTSEEIRRISTWLQILCKFWKYIECEDDRIFQCSLVLILVYQCTLCLWTGDVTLLNFCDPPHIF